jgi:hypothetical protein
MKLVALMLAMSIGASASAKTIILCKGQSHSDVVITLDDHRAFNHTLDCISGDFIADMTPCAPAGGFGLSAPTGSAALVGVVMRWQDYGDHSGAVTSHTVSADRIYFDGGVMGTGGMKMDWSFWVSRLTGEGTLHHEGKPNVAYTCGPAKQKF